MTLIVIAKYKQGEDQVVTTFHDNNIIHPNLYRSTAEKFADHCALLKKPVLFTKKREEDNLKLYYKDFEVHCARSRIKQPGINAQEDKRKYFIFHNSVIIFGGPREHVQYRFDKTIADLKESRHLNDAEITRVPQNGHSELEKAVSNLVQNSKNSFAAVIGPNNRVMLLKSGWLNRYTLMRDKTIYAVGIRSDAAADYAKTAGYFQDITEEPDDAEVRKRIREIMAYAYNSELVYQSDSTDPVHAITKSYHAVTVTSDNVVPFEEIFDE